MTPTPLPLDPPRLRPSRHPLAPLFNTGTVRLRCAQVLQSVERNLSGNFKLDRPALDRLAQQLEQHLQKHGQLDSGQALATEAAPFWHHLQAGGVDRLAELQRLLDGQPAAEQARALADLALLGVLLSADPGARWRYSEQQALPAAAFTQADPDELLALLDRAGKTALPAAAPDSSTAAPDAPSAGDVAGPTQTAPLAPPAPPPLADAGSNGPWGGRTGLAIATFRAFVAGAFSANKAQPYRVDAATLRHADVAVVRALMQGTPLNPIQGLEGRAQLMSGLGQLLQALPGGGGAQARACCLLPALMAHATDDTPAAAPVGTDTPTHPSKPLQADTVLGALLRALAPIWPTPLVQGLPAGDVWPHRWAGEAIGSSDADPTTGPGQASASDLGTSGWVPLHAMAQSLVAALALPLQRAGHRLTGLENLTACADADTCSLLLTAGVVVPRHTRLLSRSLKLGDEAAVECRALSVALFDELTVRLRVALQARLGVAAAALTVAQVVQAAQAAAVSGSPLTLRLEGDGALW